MLVMCAGLASGRTQVFSHLSTLCDSWHVVAGRVIGSALVSCRGMIDSRLECLPNCPPYMEQRFISKASLSAFPQKDIEVLALVRLMKWTLRHLPPLNSQMVDWPVLCLALEEAI